MSVSQSEAVEDVAYYIFLKDQQDHTEKIEIFDGFTCGRNKRADLVLKDARVSGWHFCFRFKEGNVYIEDQGSANQTFVNDKRIKQKKGHLLQNGDVIRVGGTLLGFSDKSDADFSRLINVTHKINGAQEQDFGFEDEATSMAIEKSSKLNLDVSGNYKTEGNKEEKRSALFKEIKERKQKIKDLQAQHANIKEKIDKASKISKDYVELKEKRQKARDHFKDRPIQEKEALNSACEKCDEEIQELKGLIQTKKEEIEELEKIIEEKTKEVQKKMSDKEGYLKDIEKAQKIDTLTQKMSDLKETIDEANDLKKQKKLGQVQKEIDEEQKTLKDKQKEYSELF